MFCTGCRTPRVIPETDNDRGGGFLQFDSYESYAQHLTNLISPEQSAPNLPAPTGWRGSGMPDWSIPRPGSSDIAYVTPVPDYNRRGQFQDSDIPTLDLDIAAGEWTYPDARNIALAILAATYWKE